MPKTKTSSKSSSANLSSIVGQEMYACWVAMLKELVPGGRTHRLSVVVAGMMQYAVSVVDMNTADDDPLAEALLESTETGDPDDFPDLVRQSFTQWKTSRCRANQERLITHKEA